MSDKVDAQPQQKKGRGNNAAVEADEAFLLTDLYPDAAALFSHDIVPLPEVVNNCVVALDANILLWPYEYSSASLEAVETVYRRLASEKRLVVPGQAAREYYKHRSRKIAAITQKIEGAIAKSNLQVFDKISILENDKDYQEAKKIAAEMVEKGKEVSKKLAGINSRLKDDIGSDRVSTLYRKVLTGSVIEIPMGRDERAAILADAQRRSRLEIAPGFKDDGKPDGGVGDLIIWRTILQEAEKRRCHTIFVTDEGKNDWWIRSKGAFHPRPELVDEYRQRSGGKSLHMLPLSGLLAAFESPPDIVQQAQILEKKRNIISSIPKEWLDVMGDRNRKNRKEFNDLKRHIKYLKNERNAIAGNSDLSDLDRSSLLEMIDEEIQAREDSMSRFISSKHVFNDQFSDEGLKNFLEESSSALMQPPSQWKP